MRPDIVARNIKDFMEIVGSLLGAHRGICEIDRIGPTKAVTDPPNHVDKDAIEIEEHTVDQGRINFGPSGGFSVSLSQAVMRGWLV